MGIFFDGGGGAPCTEKNSNANAKANANAKSNLNFVRIAEGGKKKSVLVSVVGFSIVTVQAFTKKPFISHQTLNFLENK